MVVTNMKVTTLGYVCSECHKTIADQKLLDEARNARWTCPFCKAKHISLNDQARLARCTESGDCQRQDDSDEEESCFTERIEPDKLRKIRCEFLKRTTL